MVQDLPPNNKIISHNKYYRTEIGRQSGEGILGKEFQERIKTEKPTLREYTMQ